MEAKHEEVTIARPLKRPPRLGDIIADKYRLVRTLGRGGMGRIFEADHLMLDSKVALKFMHPHLTRDPVSVGRFAREARAAATLRSPYVARIIDVDQLPSGELYIVMEYLEGASLETMARGGRGLPTADAIEFIVQACDALAEAHDRGIVHRDVKPANLFLTTGKSGEPMIKVLDFGLAKSGAVEGMTSGIMQALGTPQYMSPEQIRGAANIDPRTDVWSIGVTLYELLAGRRAFDAPVAVNVFAAILQRRYVPIRTLMPNLPEALTSIIERCLAHDPAARFANVRDLSRALEAVRIAPRPATAYKSTLVSAPSGWGPDAAAAIAAQSVSYGSGAERPVEHSTLRPVAMSGTFVGEARRGPTARQTAIAALAGPALVAMAAAVMAVVLGIGGRPTASAAASPPAGTPVNRAAVAHLTAKSGSSPRAKTASAPAAVSARCARHPRSPTCMAVARD